MIMQTEQELPLKDFLDGLPTGVYVETGYYDPECSNYDGIPEHVPGIFLRALHVDENKVAWHVGIHLVKLHPDQSRDELESEARALCRKRQWITLVDNIQWYPGMKGL